jgi:hypothetical protein
MTMINGYGIVPIVNVLCFDDDALNICYACSTMSVRPLMAFTLILSPA